jgi:phosphate transport system protein
VVNICKAARRIYGHELDPKLRGVITKMGEQATHLWTRTIEAYVENDSAKAAAIDDMDSYLDSLQRQFIQLIFESHAAGRIDLQVAVQLAVVARFYERIGDHAVNIGERVRYICTGWLPEHAGVARVAASGEPTRTPLTSAQGGGDSTPSVADGNGDEPPPKA